MLRTCTCAVCVCTCTVYGPDTLLIPSASAGSKREATTGSEGDEPDTEPEANNGEDEEEPTSAAGRLPSSRSTGSLRAQLRALQELLDAETSRRHIAEVQLARLTQSLCMPAAAASSPSSPWSCAHCDSQPQSQSQSQPSQPTSTHSSQQTASAAESAESGVVALSSTSARRPLEEERSGLMKQKIEEDRQQMQAQCAELTAVRDMDMLDAAAALRPNWTALATLRASTPTTTTPGSESRSSFTASEGPKPPPVHTPHSATHRAALLATQPLGSSNVYRFTGPEPTPSTTFAAQCTSCSCARFVPNKFHYRLCTSCTHSVDKHKNLEPSVSSSSASAQSPSTSPPCTLQR